MTDVLKQLQRASWRGLEFPVAGRDFGFQQEHEEYRFLFKDDQLIESLGRQNPTYRYQIPFREDLRVGGWKELYTSVYGVFLSHCYDRTSGELIDPVHGAVRCKCVSLSERLDVNRRDGVDVEVEFVKSPAEGEITKNDVTDIVGNVAVGAKGRAFDAAVKAVDWRQQRPPEPTINPIDAVNKFGAQFALAEHQVTAAFADTAFRAEKAIDTIDALRDPNLAPLRQQARRLQAAAYDAADRTDPTGQHAVRRILVQVDTTLSVLASQLGMSVQALVQLNPMLVRSPGVKAGTSVKVRADQQTALARQAAQARPRRGS